MKKTDKAAAAQTEKKERSTIVTSQLLEKYADLNLPYQVGDEVQIKEHFELVKRLREEKNALLAAQRAAEKEAAQREEAEKANKAFTFAELDAFTEKVKKETKLSKEAFVKLLDLNEHDNQQFGHKAAKLGVEPFSVRIFAKRFNELKVTANSHARIKNGYSYKVTLKDCSLVLESLDGTYITSIKVKSKITDFNKYIKDLFVGCDVDVIESIERRKLTERINSTFKNMAEFQIRDVFNDTLPDTVKNRRAAQALKKGLSLEATIQKMEESKEAYIREQEEKLTAKKALLAKATAEAAEKLKQEQEQAAKELQEILDKARSKK